MSFIFGLLDLVLTAVMIFDTLGIIYQFRKNLDVKSEEYIRICFSWILFLTICSLFSCDRKGIFGTLFRLIILFSKIYVTIPVLGGTKKIHKYLIEDGNAEKYYKKVVELAKSKLCKGSLPSFPSDSPSSHCQSETIEKEEEGESIAIQKEDS